MQLMLQFCLFIKSRTTILLHIKFDEALIYYIRFEEKLN